jgi:glucose/arabinose dehydrogenase
MKFLFLTLLSLLTLTAHAKNLPLEQLQLPPGFSIRIYADVPNARQMALGDKNTVFVGSWRSGKVYAIVPDAESSTGTKVLTLAEDLDAPNGVAFYKGSLYVAEPTQVLRFDNIEAHLQNPPKPVIFSTNLNKGDDHYWRVIGFGPDDKLYMGVGAPCNVCLPKDPREASLIRMNPNGSQLEIYAKGIRNTVGFDWDPLTQKLWFTDNGADLMGDNLPPEKLNYAPTIGLHFGYPYYHGKDIPDPVYNKDLPKTPITPPTFALPAHVAPLGITFYTGTLFPKQYQNQIFLAEHGSWNRSLKAGYQVMFIKLSADRQHVESATPFVSGWLQGQTYWGRPVDTLVMPDGSLLISDDYAGVVYQVSYALPAELIPQKT